ncbi:helix-turn-helix domain-containing protein (plasmid) [Bartonella sp. HY329]|uniref:helix-turn-helix domain-containing protein n=1 Tax=unclassified Bartonella TaxID=2645622 RepID=UPI0021C638BE|nr:MULTISPECIES: helix-turn-helix domain-containing protein [unclassified Bartonella]UXM96464.1 helix-turn-helix domain-containing protein [Bartonella sp. HY329]UXN10787.1 helix-turn-helix domain-containing protein [Bartonella sp. HY328]
MSTIDEISKPKPFRRKSYLLGAIEKKIFKKTDRRSLKRLLLAAKRFDLQKRQKGQRCGPLGTIALEVLEYFINIIDYKTGRLEPAIATIMRKIRRSRDSVVRALKALQNHGFINWVRRYSHNDSADGPSLKQASNAYCLNLPEKCAHLVIDNAPLCQHLSDEQIARKHQQQAMFDALSYHEQIALDFNDNPKLAQQLLQFADSFKNSKADFDI